MLTKLNLCFSIVRLDNIQKFKRYFCDAETLITIFLNLKFNNF